MKKLIRGLDLLPTIAPAKHIRFIQPLSSLLPSFTMVLIHDHQGNTRIVLPFAITDKTGLSVGDYVAITDHHETSVHLSIYLVWKVNGKSWKGYNLERPWDGGEGLVQHCRNGVATQQWKIVPYFRNLRQDRLRSVVVNRDWASFVAEHPPMSQNPAPPADWGYYRNGIRADFNPIPPENLHPLPVARAPAPAPAPARGGAGGPPMEVGFRPAPTVRWGNPGPPVFAMPDHIIASFFAMAEKCGEVPDCPICMSAVEKDTITMTPCGHIFCKPCLSQTMATEPYAGGGRCPTCRAVPTA